MKAENLYSLDHLWGAAQVIIDCENLRRVRVITSGFNIKSPNCPVPDLMRIWASLIGSAKKQAWTETITLNWSWPWNLSVLFLLQVTCFANAAMSSLKDSEEQTSLWQVIPGRWELAEKEAGSRGEQVASSHFSNTKASSGNSGWLEANTHTHS